MAGKAPLLLAMVLFFVGAAGLGLTSAERASWGPFEPPPARLAEQRVVVVEGTGELLAPPSLAELSQPFETAIASEEPAFVAVAPTEAAPQQAVEEPAATPIPPLRIFGISADDGGVSAAAATPVPIRIGGISFDDVEAAQSDVPGSTVELEPATQPEAVADDETPAE